MIASGAVLMIDVPVPAIQELLLLLTEWVKAITLGRAAVLLF